MSYQDSSNVITQLRGFCTMAPPPLEPLTMNNLPETIRTELLQVLNNLYYDVQIYLVAVVMTTIIDTHYHEYQNQTQQISYYQRMYRTNANGTQLALNTSNTGRSAITIKDLTAYQPQVFAKFRSFCIIGCNARDKPNHLLCKRIENENSVSGVIPGPRCKIRTEKGYCVNYGATSTDFLENQQPKSDINYWFYEQPNPTPFAYKMSSIISGYINPNYIEVPYTIFSHTTPENKDSSSPSLGPLSVITQYVLTIIATLADQFGSELYHYQPEFIKQFPHLTQDSAFMEVLNKTARKLPQNSQNLLEPEEDDIDQANISIDEQ